MSCLSVTNDICDGSLKDHVKKPKLSFFWTILRVVATESVTNVTVSVTVLLGCDSCMHHERVSTLRCYLTCLLFQATERFKMNEKLKPVWKWLIISVALLVIVRMDIRR